MSPSLVNGHRLTVPGGGAEPTTGSALARNFLRASGGGVARVALRWVLQARGPGAIQGRFLAAGGLPLGSRRERPPPFYLIFAHLMRTGRCLARWLPRQLAGAVTARASRWVAAGPRVLAARGWGRWCWSGAPVFTRIHRRMGLWTAPVGSAPGVVPA